MPPKKISSLIFTALGLLLPLAQTLAQANPADHPLNPLGNTSGGAPEIYGRIVRGLLGFAGVGALLYFIWGGIVILTSGGNSDKVKQGRDAILWAAVGLVIAFSSYIILNFVIKAVITSEA